MEEELARFGINRKSYSPWSTDSSTIILQKISEWKPESDIWSIKYGPTILGVAISISSAYINHRFRRKLKLRSEGRILSYAGLIVGPALMANITYQPIILSKLVTSTQICPLCMELKAATLQSLTGILYPLFLAPAINLGIAGGIGLRVPGIWEVKEIAKFWYKVCTPLLPVFGAFMVFHTIVASCLVHAQYRAIDKIRFIQSDQYYKNNTVPAASE